MRKWLSIVLVAVGGLVVLACGGDGSEGSPPRGGSGGTGGLTCETLTNPPPSCDEACPGGSDSECGAGTFCLNGVCFAQCTADEGCNTGFECGPRGRCEPVFGTGGTSGTGGNACQSVQVTPTRSIPNVMFLVDQSGSMDAAFGGGENRWEAANTVINGIVSSTDSIVRYGLTTYTSRDGDVNPPCPRLPTQIDFQLDNSVNIGDDSQYPYTYPTDAGEDTPTGDSIDALVSNIQSSPPPNEGPTIIVLATDGAPDSCEFPDPDNATERAQAQGEAVTAAGASSDAGIDLFVLWVGTLTDDNVRAHIQEVANEGVGLPADGSGGDAEFWVGTNPQSLEDAFRQIISDSISCDIALEERFVDPVAACAEGDVRLDGVQLPCSETDGWRVKPGDDQVIELVGTACDTLKTGDVTFTAEFPCGSVVVD